MVTFVYKSFYSFFRSFPRIYKEVFYNFNIHLTVKKMSNEEFTKFVRENGTVVVYEKKECVPELDYDGVSDGEVLEAEAISIAYDCNVCGRNFAQKEYYLRDDMPDPDKAFLEHMSNEFTEFLRNGTKRTET